MKRIAGPSTKTLAYRLLAALDSAPDGVLADEQLMHMLALASRTADKLAVQINVLTASKLVHRTPDALQILPRGKQYMQENYCGKVYQALPAPKPVFNGVIALLRPTPVFRPMAIGRMLRGKPMRDGMDDYRAVPSLIGGSRVSYGHQS